MQGMAMAAGQNVAYMRGNTAMAYGAMPYGMAAQMGNLAYYQNMAMVSAPHLSVTSPLMSAAAVVQATSVGSPETDMRNTLAIVEKRQTDAHIHTEMHRKGSLTANRNSFHCRCRVAWAEATTALMQVASTSCSLECRVSWVR
jgi:hypothetical protein